MSLLMRSIFPYYMTFRACRPRCPIRPSGLSTSRPGVFRTDPVPSNAGTVRARYKGPQDFAAPISLAVSPTGQGDCVTGSIGVHDGCCNFGTVAYQP